MITSLIQAFSPDNTYDEATLAIVDQALDVIGLLLLAVLASWLFRRFVLSRFEELAEKTDNDIDDRLVYFLRRFYWAIVGFVVLLLVLNVLGIEITPLLAGAGLAGFAIAYASKDVLGNFLSGIFLLLDQPIKIGDRIMIERIGSQWGSWGDVVDVGLRTTTVRNTDGVNVTYPNAKLAESVIKNFTPNQEPVRFRLRVMVDLDNDLRRALDVLTLVGTDHPEVLEEPRPSSVVRELFSETGGHMHQGALLELRCYVSDIKRRTPLRSELLLLVHERFREHGIKFAHLEVGIQPAYVSEAG